MASISNQLVEASEPVHCDVHSAVRAVVLVGERDCYFLVLGTGLGGGEVEAVHSCKERQCSAEQNSVGWHITGTESELLW